MLLHLRFEHGGPCSNMWFVLLLIATKQWLNILAMPIHDFKHVRLVPIEWLSPFTLCVSLGGVLPDEWHNQPVAKRTGPMVEFLNGAAQQAFWQLPVASITRLAFAQFKLTLTGTDVDILSALILHILKCDDLELAKILEKMCIGISIV